MRSIRSRCPRATPDSPSDRPVVSVLSGFLPERLQVAVEIDFLIPDPARTHSRKAHVLDHHAVPVLYRVHLVRREPYPIPQPTDLWCVERRAHDGVGLADVDWRIAEP